MSFWNTPSGKELILKFKGTKHRFKCISIAVKTIQNSQIKNDWTEHKTK